MVSTKPKHKETMRDLFIQKNYKAVDFLAKQGVRLCPFRDSDYLFQIVVKNSYQMMKYYVRLFSGIIQLEEKKLIPQGIWVRYDQHLSQQSAQYFKQDAKFFK